MQGKKCNKALGKSVNGEKPSVTVIIKSKSHSHVLTHFFFPTDLLGRFHDNLHFTGRENEQLVQIRMLGFESSWFDCGVHTRSHSTVLLPMS